MIAEFGPLFEKINIRTTEYISQHYDPNDTVEERFFNYWFYFVKYGVEYPFDFMHMVEVTSSHLYPLVGEQPSARFMQQAREILAQGIAEKKVKDMNISTMNQIIRGGLVNLLRCSITSGKTLTDEEISDAVKALWDAVKAN